MPSSDAIVVGGGHNGLAAAALLARAGRSVTLLEAGPELGGGARDLEFAPGFRVSALAHTVNRLHPELVRRLDLAGHGLAFAARAIPTTVLSEGSAPLVLHGGWGERIEGDLPAAEATAFRELRAKLLRFAGVLKSLETVVPPRLKGGGPGDAVTLARLGLKLRSLGRDDMREFLRMAMMNVHDLLDEEIADPRLRALVGFDAVLGSRLGPRSPTSLLALLHRLAGEASGVPGALDLPRGGAATLARALATAAERAGARLRTGAQVERVIVEGGRAVGVRLAGGEEVRAALVVSAADPKTTFLDLVGPAELDIGLVRRIRAVRASGTVARVVLAVRTRPGGPGLSEAMLAGRLVLADGVEAIERAFDAAKYEEVPERPALEVTVPSLADPSLAPPGQHVVSVHAIHAPTRPRIGPDRAREAMLAAAIATLERHLPGLGASVVASRCLMPADIEREFMMPGGHWHHGELSPDQMFSLRPVQAASRYRTPIDGLYLCGAGSHPGGGLSGAPALAAVNAILEDGR